MSNSSELTGLLPSPHGNASLIENNDLCTLSLCDLTLAHVDYLPSLPGNALFAALFGICLIAQLFLGIKYRTWGYMAASMLGMVTEVIGYIGRVMMHSNPFNDSFLLYLVTLTIAPAFLTAAIYLCLARIVVVYGEEWSRFKPRTYTILFCTCDFLALLLQAAGGAIASGSNSQSSTQVGINVMLAGLSFQVFSLLLFTAACVELGLRIYCSARTPGHPYSSNASPPFPPRSGSPSSITSGAPLHTSLPKTTLFRSFLVGLSVATLTIFIRCCFRVAELSKGFDGSLANNEVLFMVLEATMVIIACIALTVYHPGICFQGEWRAANFKMGKKKTSSDLEAKRFSAGSSSGESEVGTGEPEPPHYTESAISVNRSTVSVDSRMSFNEAASLREGSVRSSRSFRATAVRAVPVTPHQVHFEMLPVYGVRYESTSDALSAPTS